MACSHSWKHLLVPLLWVISNVWYYLKCQRQSLDFICLLTLAFLEKKQCEYIWNTYINPFIFCTFHRFKKYIIILILLTAEVCFEGSCSKVLHEYFISSYTYISSSKLQVIKETLCSIFLPPSAIELPWSCIIKTSVTPFGTFFPLQTKLPYQHRPHSITKGRRSAPKPSQKPERLSGFYALQFKDETPVSRGLTATMMCLWASPSSRLSNEWLSTRFTFSHSPTHPRTHTLTRSPAHKHAQTVTSYSFIFALTWCKYLKVY